jgi:drug/metabolite transporter (DMT)-like permease
MSTTASRSAVVQPGGGTPAPGQGAGGRVGASRLATWGAFAGCTLVWGSTFLFISIGNDTVPPVWGAALRLAIAVPVLLLLGRAARQPLPRGAALRYAAIYGLLQFGINFPLLYWGETRVPSGLAAVVFATIPLTSALLARAFGLETLSAAKIGGAVVALAGIAFIFSGQLRGEVGLVPLLAVLVASWVACLGTVLLKRGPRQPAIGANAVATIVGLVACVLLSAALGERMALPTTWAALGPILYLALAGSVGAFVLMAWLINHWDVTRISYIAVITPLVALALGAWVRHERFGAGTLAGSLLVMIGVVVGVRPARAPRAGSVA